VVSAATFHKQARLQSSTSTCAADDEEGSIFNAKKLRIFLKYLEENEDMNTTNEVKWRGRTNNGVFVIISTTAIKIALKF
jgi:hypothetical protein